MYLTQRGTIQKKFKTEQNVKCEKQVWKRQVKTEFCMEHSVLQCCNEMKQEYNECVMRRV